MFNKDFYPTPKHVIEIMINGHDLAGKTILEPSAGSGNILEVAKNYGARTLACEIDKKLQIITQKKADEFLKEDFLEVRQDEISHVDFIYMNPPFSAGDKHILHAWEIAPEGCEVVALCNYETLNNPYSRLRSRLATILKNYGDIESLGDCFADAERKTGVEVGLLRLFKPASANNFEAYFDFTPDEEEQQENGIMGYNAVREIVNRYVHAVKLYDEVAENAAKMRGLVGEFASSDITFMVTHDEKETTIERFKINLQKNAWQWVFKKMNMGKFMTENLKAELNAFSEKQSNVPFTMKNIYRMMEMVIQTHGQRMDRVILEVFDKLTERYDDNRYDVEGWKTNSHYLVNKKFILNHVFEIGWSGQLQSNWNSYNGRLIEDLIKALDFITGKRHFDELVDPKAPHAQSLYNYTRSLEMTTNKWYDMGYFQFKGFKKGTGHFKWKDLNDWAMFNQAVSKIKGWPLPEKI